MNQDKEETGPGHRYLRKERQALEKFMPGLDQKLCSIPLQQRETPKNPCLSWLKEVSGQNLVIPKKFGGLGASPKEIMQVHRAIASRSPSLAIICTMHNFSASTLVEYAIFGEEYGEALLMTIANEGMLLASGFAEARPGARPLEMTMTAHATEDEGWRINGVKKPCTLSSSADFLTAGVTAYGKDNVPHRAVALIPRDTPGIVQTPFWINPVLAGAESEQLTLTDVEVPGDFVFLADNDEALDPVELTGYVWLQMCLAASYIGMGSALIEMVLEKGTRISSVERMSLVSELESQFIAVEHVADGLAAGESNEELLGKIVAIRFAAMSALERTAMKSAELLGGMHFVKSGDVSYLMSATRALAFHPPSRNFGCEALSRYYDGHELDLA